MYSKVRSVGLHGIEGFFVDVEVTVSNGLPCMDFVGALGTEVKEAKERVKAALHQLGIGLPAQRITVNLSPGDLRKEGCAYDLPIAAVLLKALGLLPELPEDLLLLGELGLDGSVRAVNGVLPTLMYSKENGALRCVVPADNAGEAALVEGMEVRTLHTLAELLEVRGDTDLLPGGLTAGAGHAARRPRAVKDMSDIAGQKGLKRAVLIAAAGLHNILIVGPPGSGKTMAAERIPGILPELTMEEKLELTKIYSVRGELDREYPLVEERPFRTVHQRMTLPALLGGGRIPAPGEISLAHRGVLFLDEAAEFSRAALESLRGPLEAGEISVNRLYGQCVFPARFMLAAAANPCPCGYYPDYDRCTCTPAQIRHYRKRFSGPLLDRIDLQVHVRRVDYKDLERGRTVGADPSEGSPGAETADREICTSAQMRGRVEEAAERQRRRFRNEDFLFNSHIPSGKVRIYCRTDTEADRLLGRAYESMGLTARSYHRVLKTARTIADLAGAELIRAEHVSEALAYRKEEDL